VGGGGLGFRVLRARIISLFAPRYFGRLLLFRCSPFSGDGKSETESPTIAVDRNGGPLVCVSGQRGPVWTTSTEVRLSFFDGRVEVGLHTLVLFSGLEARYEAARPGPSLPLRPLSPQVSSKIHPAAPSTRDSREFAVISGEWRARPGGQDCAQSPKPAPAPSLKRLALSEIHFL
jgi:hypothetical protein